MRILQVVHGLPPYEWAGAELVTLHLAQALRKRGHEVTVFTRAAGAGEEFSVREEHYEGLRVVRVLNNYTYHTSFRLFYDNSFFHEPFLRLLDQTGPDIVHFQHLAHLSVNLIPLAAALGYPTVLSLHDFFFPCERIHLIDARLRLCPGPDRGERCVPCLQERATAEEARRRFFYMEDILQAVDRILTPSRFLAERMECYFPVLRGQLQTVPLGIKAVPRLAVRHAPGMPLRILCIGVLMPHKGAHLLIEALRGLPTGALEVSFYGTVVPFWRGYVDRLREAAHGLAVRFSGSYPHDQLATILAQYDVLVVPALCEETFSLVAREALMAGLPVVAARQGALLEVVQDEVNGLFFEPGNAADLRRCLWRLLTEPGLWARLHAHATETQVKTLEAYTEEIEQVYVAVRNNAKCRGEAQAGTDLHRLTATRHVVVGLSRENMSLRREHTRCHQALAVSEQERLRLQQEREQVQQEWERTLSALRRQEELLGAREAELQQYSARLAAIYASTTWKLYQGYAFLRDSLVRRPLRTVRQWLSN